jgi:hypothetical protein
MTRVSSWPDLVAEVSQFIKSLIPLFQGGYLTQSLHRLLQTPIKYVFLYALRAQKLGNFSLVVTFFIQRNFNGKKC